MEYEGILILASEHEKYKTKTKKLVPPLPPTPPKKAFNLLQANYHLSTCDLAEILITYLWFENWHFT